VKIKLIIFDIDGTLVDSSIDITNALNYATEPYNLEKLTVKKTISMVGEGLTRLVEKLLGEDRSEILPEVMDRFLDYYSEHLTDFTLPYPGVRETLEELRNYKKAVISNKREFLTRRLLEKLELLKYFDIVMGSDSIGEKKPSPKPVIHVLKMLSLKPEEAIIIGDSNYDIDAGKAAGVTTMAVSYGFRDVRLLKEADYIIDNIKELLLKLNRLNKV
jgi:phosphoglycolate phosphatase